MIEIIAAFARWSQLTANLIVFGSCIFLVIIGQQRNVLETPWILRLEKMFPWLAGIIVIGLFGVLATTTSDATGDVSNAWNPAVWLEIIQKTQIGHIWVARALLATALLAATIKMLCTPSRFRWHYAVCALLAALPLIAGTLMSHSSADEMSFEAVAPYAIHILLAGIWFGALPAFLFILSQLRGKLGATPTLIAIDYLKKFSTVALAAMILLALTGIIVTDRLVDEKYHTLVSSPYGWLLNLKLIILAVILAIAYQARNKWLPMLSRPESKQRTDSLAHFSQWVRIEFVLALGLVLVATILANTLPAKHTMVELWPYPFRFSIGATWEQPDVQEKVWFGVALLALALATAWFSSKQNAGRMLRILVPAALSISSLALALPPLAIKAYPETYLKPTVPIDAISIVTGSRLFAEHCAACHGPQGKGTKPVPDPDVRDPTDLLTQQHTAEYTVGNVFHRLSHGIPGTEMPGFADKLSEEDRWDLINFLHAMSRGFDARLLGTMIAPEMPAIASPVFDYAASNGSNGNFKDFRLQKNVLLVLFAWPQSKERFFQLAAAYERIQALNTEILAVPIYELSEQQLQQITEIAPFPIVTEGWPEIKDAYWWYRRIRTVPDLSGKGLFPEHMEFVTDRFGYLRARWVAQFEGFGWQNINALTLQLTQLNQEGEIMPPPGEHAH
jgi:putative copper resistance protein D